MSNEFKNEVFSRYSPHPIGQCSNCRKTPSLVLAMLNPRTGGTVRMFKCDCGEQIWSEEKK
jgi:hypothetical protein